MINIMILTTTIIILHYTVLHNRGKKSFAKKSLETLVRHYRGSKARKKVVAYYGGIESHLRSLLLLLWEADLTPLAVRSDVWRLYCDEHILRPTLRPRALLIAGLEEEVMRLIRRLGIESQIIRQGRRRVCFS